MKSYLLNTNDNQALAGLADLPEHVETAKQGIADAKSVADIKTAICKVWSKIAPFIGIAEKLPIIGGYISALAEVLNAICTA